MTVIPGSRLATIRRSLGRRSGVLIVVAESDFVCAIVFLDRAVTGEISCPDSHISGSIRSMLTGMNWIRQEKWFLESQVLSDTVGANSNTAENRFFKL